MTKVTQLGILKKETIKRVREDSTGSYVNGRWVSSATTTTDLIKASVQPPNRNGSKRIERLPEAQRDQEWIVVYAARDTFRGVDIDGVTKADKIEYRGKLFEVSFINNWGGQIINHDEVFAMRITTK